SGHFRPVPRHHRHRPGRGHRHRRGRQPVRRTPPRRHPAVALTAPADSERRPAMAIASGMFRTKSVEQSIRDTDEPDSKLRKDLTAKDLTIFGVAVVIGAGIFTLTARTAGTVAGPSVSLAFVFAAIACGLTALC